MVIISHLTYLQDIFFEVNEWWLVSILLCTFQFPLSEHSLTCAYLLVGSSTFTGWGNSVLIIWSNRWRDGKVCQMTSQYRYRRKMSAILLSIKLILKFGPGSLFSSPFTQSPVNTLAIVNVRAQTRKGRIVRAPRNWTCDSATSPQHRWIIKVIARSIKLNIRFAVKRVDQKKHSEYMLNLTMKATLKGAVKRDYE